MKKNKKLFIIILLILFAVLLSACDTGNEGKYAQEANGNERPESEYDADGFLFTLIQSGTAYKISIGNATAAKIVIPEEFKGLPVTLIDNFQNCNFLTSIVIPNTITQIELGAFSGCSVLTSMSIPKTYGPTIDGVRTMAMPVLGYMFGTTSYDGGTAVRHRYHAAGIPSDFYYDIPDVFYVPSSLRTVTIGIDSLEPDNPFAGGMSLGSGTFSGCSMLKQVILRKNINDIGAYAFYGCTNLSVFSERAPSTMVVSADMNKSILYHCSLSSDKLYVVSHKHYANMPYGSKPIPYREGYNFIGWDTLYEQDFVTYKAMWL